MASAALPELNLFEEPVKQNTVLRFFLVDFRPTSQIVSQDAPVSFTLGGDSGHYLDLKRCRLNIKLRLLKDDGTDLTEAESGKVCPINLILHSVWSQLELRIGGRLISSSNNHYGYKSIIHTLLKASADAKESHLQLQGFYEDTKPIHKVENNAGATARADLFKSSKSVILEGPILEDFFQNNRYLLNNTSVELKLYRARQNFICMSDDDTLKVKIELEDVTFRAYYVDVSPDVVTAHAAALLLRNAMYPYIRTDILSFSIASGSHQMNIDNIFSGICPTKIVVAFVDSDAFIGDRKKNPFAFELFGLTDIQVLVDGVSSPGRPIRVGAGGEKNTVASALAALTDTIGAMTDLSFGNNISLKSFAEGTALFAFPVYGGGSACDVFEHPKKSANIRIEGTFARPLDKTITAIVYGEYPALLQIQASRHVILT
jgi:hypothetical protein